MGKRKGKGKIAERHGFDSAGQLGHTSGDYTVNVSELSALAVDVVLACVRLIADLTADADVAEYRGRERIDPPSRLVRRPMATMTRRSWLWQLSSTMALYNGAYLDRDAGGGRDSEGVPLSLAVVAPPRVSSWGGSHLALDGIEIDPDRLVWVPRMTFPTVSGDAAWAIRLTREVIGAAWAAEAYRADFWSHGGAPTTILTTDQDINQTRADEIADRWVAKRAAGPGQPAVLGKGFDARLFGADVATKGAAEAGERLGTSIARGFGVPAWSVNVPTLAGSMAYNNVSAAGLDLVRYTLRPGYAGPIGDALTDELPGDAVVGRTVRLGLDHLTHGTMLERFQAYTIATGGQPWMDAGEVRDEINLPPSARYSLDPNGAPAPQLEVIPNG